MSRVKFRSAQSQNLFGLGSNVGYQTNGRYPGILLDGRVKIHLAQQVRSVTSETLLHADSLSYDTLCTLAGTNNLGSVRNLTIRLRWETRSVILVKYLPSCSYLVCRSREKIRLSIVLNQVSLHKIAFTTKSSDPFLLKVCLILENRPVHFRVDTNFLVQAKFLLQSPPKRRN